jgi:hypothetical protein
MTDIQPPDTNPATSTTARLRKILSASGHTVERFFVKRLKVPAYAVLAMVILVAGSVVTVGLMSHTITSYAAEKKVNAALLVEVEFEYDYLADQFKAMHFNLNSAQQAVAESWTLQTELDARELALDAREAALTGGQKAAVTNTFSGDGKFLIGEEVAAGRYTSDGGERCMWRREDGTGKFLDSHDNSGPTVVIILATDGAISVSNCAPFTKM